MVAVRLLQRRLVLMARPPPASVVSATVVRVLRVVRVAPPRVLLVRTAASAVFWHAAVCWDAAVLCHRASQCFVAA